MAHADGRIKRGDRLLSVNGNNLSGVTNKFAQLLLKDAGLHVNIVIARKIGRRGTSAMTTPLASTLHSRRSSGEQSKQESKQGSPKMTRKLQRGGSSDEGSKEGSKATTPPTASHHKVHRRRQSIGVGGEVLVFREKSRTLPRKLSSMVGVRLVELHKGPTGLGMQVKGGTDYGIPITVKVVIPGGVAQKSGKIFPGDIILEANKVSFENLTRDEATKTLKGFPQGKVSLIIRDRTASLKR